MATLTAPPRSTAPPGRTLDDAALAPVIGRGRWSRLLVVVLSIPVLAGVAAFVYQWMNGLEVTGLNDDVFWGIYTVDLVTLIGFSYGGALVSAILRLSNARWRGPITRLAEGTALVTLLVGALFPVIHLGHPERAWSMLVRPQLNSPLVWDMVAILTYLLATALLFGLPLIPDVGRLQHHPGLSGWRRRLYGRLAVRWQGLPSQRSVLGRAATAIAIVIIPVAVMVHTVLSYAFSLTSRPGWHSTIFGPYFVLAAVYSGIGIVILATVAYRRAYRLERWIPEIAIRRLSYLMVALGLAYAYFMFTEITTEGYVGEESAQALLYGTMLDRFSPLFWAFVVAGLVVPILLVAVPRTRTITGMTVSAGLVVAMLGLKRFLMIVPPLTRPLIGSEAGTYQPSWVELTVTAGAIAAIPLLLVLIFRVLPVLSVDEIEELAAEATRDAAPDAAGGQPT